MPDEFQTPKEFTKPSEFPKVKEVYISSPEFLDRPVGYGTTGKSSKEGKSRSSNIRKMMMYLAATVTTMGSVLMFSTEAAEQRFDMREYVKTHRDWYCPDDDEYIYMGDNGIAWIAQRSEDGQIFNDFYHYKKWCYLLEETGEYTFNGYGYDIDWLAAEVDSKKVITTCRFVKTGDGYIVEAYDGNDPSLSQKIYPVDPSEADYPGKQQMLKYLDAGILEILNDFNTYVMENDAPVYTDIEKIVFNQDGTGTFRIKGKERKFTYTADNDDKANCFITINYNGRSARAGFFFYGERPTMMFFGGLENDPRSFAAFISVEPKDADKKSASNERVNSGDNNLPTSPDEPQETKPSDEGPRPVNASYLTRKRDWYCKELDTLVFFGESGTGYAFNKNTADNDNLYSRFIYQISGSNCECVIEQFDFQSMMYKTQRWSFTAMETGQGIQLWLNTINGKKEELVFKEYSGDLNCYVNGLAGMNTGSVLRLYRRFNIAEDSFIVNGITALEFTGKDSGIIHYNEDGKSKESPFTYNTEGKGIDAAFYLYYNGEKYLGQVFYSRTGPGITLFNPSMDGTHGKFVAG